MISKKWHYLFLLFLCFDLGYSFCQYKSQALDGDMAHIILPSAGYEPLMDDPLGISIITENKRYASPNRFFAHFTMSVYFRTIPFLFQKIVTPIESIYLTCALMKTAIHISLLWLFAVYISGKRKVLDADFLIAAVLVFPLFHTTGYYQYMGIVDHSITYAMFYALPMSLLLIFFLPFYSLLFFKKEIKISIVQKIILFLFAVFISLNGPLVPAIVLLLCLFLFFAHLKKPDRLNFFKTKHASFYFGLLFFIAIVSLYSLYIGRFSLEGGRYEVSLLEAYKRLPLGLFNILTGKVGFFLLLLMITLNLFLINRKTSGEGSQRIFTILKWLAIFSIAYILLLPLGGSRDYRPNFIRRDTFLPITIGIIYAYGLTSFYLIKNISSKYKKPYFAGLLLFLFIFTSVDMPIGENNLCEKEALKKIANSKDKVLELNIECNVMSWQKITNKKDSETNSILLQFWNISDEKKLYFQK